MGNPRWPGLARREVSRPPHVGRTGLLAQREQLLEPVHERVALLPVFAIAWRFFTSSSVSAIGNSESDLTTRRGRC